MLSAVWLVTATAMLRANACWALGELAATDAVPPAEAHAALLGCLTDPAGAEHPALRSWLKKLKKARSVADARLLLEAGGQAGRRQTAC